MTCTFYVVVGKRTFAEVKLTSIPGFGQMLWQQYRYPVACDASSETRVAYARRYARQIGASAVVVLKGSVAREPPRCEYCSGTGVYQLASQYGQRVYAKCGVCGTTAP